MQSEFLSTRNEIYFLLLIIETMKELEKYQIIYKLHDYAIAYTKEKLIN
jgi:hypothetical protein